MEKLLSVTGIAATLLRDNIDTDQIIPGKELVRVHTEGYSASLFAHWRYSKDREPDPGFLLNREPWKRASILITGRNFGCGSSREAAPKALREFGFRAIVAPSFGGIFYNNAFRNGIVPVELAPEIVQGLAGLIENCGGQSQMTVDIEASLVIAPDGKTYRFMIPELFRKMLVKGMDEIDLTLENRQEIENFRQTDGLKRPWAY